MESWDRRRGEHERLATNDNTMETPAQRAAAVLSSTTAAKMPQNERRVEIWNTVFMLKDSFRCEVFGDVVGSNDERRDDEGEDEEFHSGYSVRILSTINDRDLPAFLAIRLAFFFACGETVTPKSMRLSLSAIFGLPIINEVLTRF
jgi:hypothetical protein